MEEDEITEELDEDTQEEDVEETVTAPASKMNMRTLPIKSEATDSEKISRIEQLINELCIRFGDEDESRTSYDQIIEYFNYLKKSSDELIRKLDNEVVYTKNLDDQIRRKNVELENLQLRKEIAEHRSLLTMEFEKIQSAVNESLKLLQIRNEMFEKTYTDKMDLFEAKIDEFKAEQDSVENLKDQIQEIIEGFRKDMGKESEKQYMKLINDSTNVLNACNQRMSEVKADVIAFLKSCQNQNKTLIGNIPSQKKRFSWQEWALIGACLFSTTVSVINMILVFI